MTSFPSFDNLHRTFIDLQLQENANESKTPQKKARDGNLEEKKHEIRKKGGIGVGRWNYGNLLLTSVKSESRVDIGEKSKENMKIKTNP